MMVPKYYPVTDVAAAIKSAFGVSPLAVRWRIIAGTQAVLRQRSEGDFAKSPFSAYTSFAPYTLIQ
jgi:hypothetical protein